MTAIGNAPAEQPTVYAELALDTLTRVLGVERARRIYADTLNSAALGELRTADDLYTFAQQLSTRGGFEAAVGGLLSVAAVLRGASGERN